MPTQYADDLEPGDTITTLDEANQAAIRQDMAIRVQPPAPQPTEYYFYDAKTDAWKRQKCGHSVAATMRVDGVRERLSDAIERGQARVVTMGRVEKYA